MEAHRRTLGAAWLLAVPMLLRCIFVVISEKRKKIGVVKRKNWLERAPSFCMVLHPRSGAGFSPFFGIQEGLCKWIVFNFQGCDLKNKEGHLLIQCCYQT